MRPLTIVNIKLIEVMMVLYKNFIGIDIGKFSRRSFDRSSQGAKVVSKVTSQEAKQWKSICFIIVPL